MSYEEVKPDPDELLKAIQKEEMESKVGRLKIFFGMSAGVGKTYSMLEAAQARLKEGINVAIGTINTHGRKETEALLKDLPVIPERWIKYKDTVFEEMDLETILSTKPQLVIVDELAHTNVPGSKHPKRWQDVIEILDAGIDVYASLNVQHIESRKDLVESMTGIQVHETVPDLLLERAASIELIDLPPQELLKRLKEGKVYTGDQSRLAAEHFFQESNLTALREIALRFTAEKVDHDLHGMLHGKGWKTRERLLVAISPSPFSEQLIRSARRLAFQLDAPWTAVFVDTGIPISDKDQARLSRFLSLARDLGAEVITTQDLDIASALLRIAKQRDITRIVIGRPRKNRGLFRKDNLIDRLAKENRFIDLVILRNEKISSIYERTFPMIKMTSPWSSYGISFAAIAILTVLNFFINFYMGYKIVGLIYLIGILAVSFFVNIGPILFAALLSTIAWNYLFIPPLLTHKINEIEDIALIIIYFLAAAILGALTSRMRQREQFLHQREEKIERLYEIERDIASAANLQNLRLNISSRLENIFPGKFDLLIKGQDNNLIFDSPLPLFNSDKEQAAANWVLKNGKTAGWSTDTLPSAEGLYFPIKYVGSAVGVIAFHPGNGKRTLSLDEMNFILTVAQQLGIYLERYFFQETINRQEYALQVERMHQSIFHSLNRSFYIPLETIMSLNSQIMETCSDENTKILVSQMERFILRIQFAVENIIAMSELESGFVHFERRTHLLKDLIEQTLQEVHPLLGNHKAYFEILSIRPNFPFDFNLLKIALKNLILNALEYSPPQKPIRVKAEASDSVFCLSVIDEGSGIPEKVLPQIFEKFYHAPGTLQGLGLGLAIVKLVAAIHQGKIKVVNRKEGGTEITLELPT